MAGENGEFQRSGRRHTLSCLLVMKGGALEESNWIDVELVPVYQMMVKAM